MSKIYFVLKLLMVILVLSNNNVFGSIRYVNENLKSTDTLNNDLKLVKPLINFNDPNGGFYSQYYVEQLNSLYCGAIVKNNGTITASHVYLNIQFLDFNHNPILSYNSDTINVLSTNEIDTLNISQNIDVTTILNNYLYYIVYNIESDSLDDNIYNNIDTVPFTEFYYSMWTHASRSIVCTDTFSVNRIQGFQSGDFIGIKLKVPNFSFHSLGLIGVYFTDCLNINDTVTGVLYMNGHKIGEFLQFYNNWTGFYYSQWDYWSSTECCLYQDSTYYVGIELKYFNENNIPIGIDTSYYHNFESEGIARIGGSWVNIDFVPLIQLVCDMEGISENKIRKEIKVFPNPAKDFITIENVSNSRIELFDVKGSLLLSVECFDNVNKIDLSKYKEGSYLLRITNDNEVVNNKIILIK